MFDEALLVAWENKQKFLLEIDFPKKILNFMKSRKQTNLL